MISHKTRWKSSSAGTLLANSHSKTPKIASYCLDVLEGRIPVGRPVFLAVERHLADLERGGDRGLRWDDAAAAHVIEFFEKFLCLAEGDNDGQPFLLRPWQQFVLGSLFGWKSADGYRRFRTAYIELGKGNGKSPLAAGIGLYGLVADNEASAEIYSAAVVKDQAKILFRDAENMRDLSPHLRAKVQKHVNNLSVLSTKSFFRPISSEKRGLDGKRPHIVLVDEVHEHPSPIVIDKMRAGTKGRRQAMIFEITNSGYDRLSVCYTHHDYSVKVLDGIIENDSWFGYVAQLDPCEECRRQGRVQPSCENCDSWLDESTWVKANPNLGISIHPKYLREQVAEAVAMPSKENTVKRLNFCVWTEADVRAIGAEAWAGCAHVDAQANPVEIHQGWIHNMRGQVCFAGLDLADTTDLAAEVYWFPETTTNPLPRVIPFFYCPEESIRRRSEKDRVPYDIWVKCGLITPTPGNVIDYDFIRAKINEHAAQFRVLEMGFDPYNATQLVSQLMSDGMVMVEHRQGFISMSAPTKELLRRVLSGELAHGNNPVLTWMATNLVTTQDPAGLLKPDKAKAREKIDGMVGLIMALGRSMARPEVPTGAPAIWRV